MGMGICLCLRTKHLVDHCRFKIMHTPYHKLFFVSLFSLIFLCCSGVASSNPFETTNHSQPYSQDSDEDSSTVVASIASEYSSIQPGSSFLVAINLKMKKDWHTYWRYAGEVGFPTEIKWDLPKGITNGDIIWPTPHKFIADDIVNYGYKDNINLLVKMTTSKDIAMGDVTLKGDVSWLACKESCIPGEQTLSTAITIAKANVINSKTTALFTQSKNKIPRKNDFKNLQLNKKNHTYFISLNTIEFSDSFKPKEVIFFPYDDTQIPYNGSQKITLTNDKICIEIEALKNASEAFLNGVLLFKNANQEFSYEIQIRPSDNKKNLMNTEAQSTENTSLFMILIFAFIGGFILNFMPCVFPVISLKVTGFVKQAEESRGTAISHALTFSLGIITTFLALAGLLLALRSGGSAIGWGFHLQSAEFVGGLALLMFFIALNLFGVFEVGINIASTSGTVREKGGFVGSFLSGVLATLIATPCTAPFMGGALGFALTQPAYISLLVFFSLGLGMAIPYVVLSSSKTLSSLLPKPGLWMVTFKHCMGFLVLFTVLWLVNLFNSLSDFSSTFNLLGIFIFSSIGAWVYGKWGTMGATLTSKSIARAIALCLIIVPIIYAMSDKKEDIWTQWTPEIESKLLTNNQPYFIDFTADWCLSCKVNERVVLASKDVLSAFRNKNITMLKADWTKQDASITHKLAQYNRTGVPFYLLVGSDGLEIELAEVLTPNAVLEAIESI